MNNSILINRTYTEITPESLEILANFKLIGSTLERCEYEREFSGKMTKARYKLIDQFCRKNTFNTNCGCLGDCCGHICEQRITFKYSYNQVVITCIRIFNY